MNWDKLIASIYSEQDFGRSIATTVAGIVGLVMYLLVSDWVIALFASIIAFPVCRVISSALHSKWKQKHIDVLKRLKAEKEFSRFSQQERQVIEFFVREGGACVSWGRVNNSQLPFPRAGLNSLIARDLVRASVMEDGMSESFVLDIDTFDYAQTALRTNKESKQLESPHPDMDEDIPF